jgi:hypothetical protein
MLPFTAKIAMVCCDRRVRVHTHILHVTYTHTYTHFHTRAFACTASHALLMCAPMLCYADLHSCAQPGATPMLCYADLNLCAQPCATPAAVRHGLVHDARGCKANGGHSGLPSQLSCSSQTSVCVCMCVCVNVVLVSISGVQTGSIWEGRSVTWGSNHQT